MKASSQIKQFLDFINSTEEQYAIAQCNRIDADAATQDILHHIELHECSSYDYICLALSLKGQREKRRKAKDEETVLAPVVDWIKENKKEISKMQQLLGVVRKAESSTVNRIYRNRTDVVKNALKDFDE